MLDCSFSFCFSFLNIIYIKFWWSTVYNIWKFHALMFPLTVRLSIVTPILLAFRFAVACHHLSVQDAEASLEDEYLIAVFLAWSFENAGNFLVCWRLAGFCCCCFHYLYFYLGGKKTSTFVWYLIFLKFQKCAWKICMVGIMLYPCVMLYTDLKCILQDYFIFLLRVCVTALFRM